MIRSKAGMPIWREFELRHEIAMHAAERRDRGSEEDDVIPISSAKRLFEVANEPKAFVSVSGGNHLVLGLGDVFPRVCDWIEARTLVTLL
jgi:hypothetical protein